MQLMEQDVRWLQRFSNFDRALTLLQEALATGPSALSTLEKEGTVHRFEYTLELGWKTLKDYLEFSGITLDPVTPRQVIKEAFAAKLIPDGALWLAMLNHRNVLSHTYDEAVSTEAVEQIDTRYLPAFQALRQTLSQTQP